ncbi:MAG: Gfo/Idh/MocA family oxidoreductase, partial [Acidobacteriota bacterium]|nr:Gfo/Idh/MocA family oxidoreductase [Acidobacteriota bacterium]
MDFPVNKTEKGLEIDASKTDEEFVNRAKSSSNPVLRVGVVGAGLMGRWHAHAAHKASGGIVCVADTNQNQAVQLAKRYRTAQGFGDLREMLKQKSLDVLHICTPTSSHHAIAEIAIKANINLFIEKPLTLTAAETKHLYDLGAENDVRLCPAHQFAFQHCVQKAKKILPRIGKIIHLQATLCSAGAAGLADKYLDSVAFDILPHPLSLFQTFLNGKLSEEAWDISRPERGELRISGYAHDVSLSIFVSMNARPTVNSLQIIGTNGTIHLDLFHDFAVLDKGKVSKGRKILHPFDSAVKKFSAATFNLARRTIQFESAYPGLRRLVNNFYQTIREGAEPPISPAQA